MFFEYNQNNSGGSFIEEPENGIGHIVIIEADSAGEADEIAERIGIYFDEPDENGELQYDCECCGTRWSPAWRGEEAPNIYGRAIVDGKIAPIEDREALPWDNVKWMKGPEGYIHYKDGRVEPFDY